MKSLKQLCTPRKRVFDISKRDTVLNLTHLTAAATGNYSAGRNRGWRNTVRFALTENPITHRVSDQPTVPEFFRLVSQHESSGESLPVRRRGIFA
jgi:hypothetical protein